LLPGRGRHTGQRMSKRSAQGAVSGPQVAQGSRRWTTRATNSSPPCAEPGLEARQRVRLQIICHGCPLEPARTKTDPLRRRPRDGECDERTRRASVPARLAAGPRRVGHDTTIALPARRAHPTRWPRPAPAGDGPSVSACLRQWPAAASGPRQALAGNLLVIQAKGGASRSDADTLADANDTSRYWSSKRPTSNNRGLSPPRRNAGGVSFTA